MRESCRNPRSSIESISSSKTGSKATYCLSDSDYVSALQSYWNGLFLYLGWGCKFGGVDGPFDCAEEGEVFPLG